MSQGRNDPCACGSGKKYKKCCQAKIEATRSEGIAQGNTTKYAPAHAEINQLVALFNASSYAELESHARLLVNQYPESGIAWKALATSLRVQGKDALSALQKATQLLPDDAEEHFNLANVLHDLGQLDAAVVSYRRAVEVRPNYMEAHSNLGVLLKDMGRLEEAEASYRRALQINPNFAEMHCNLGDALTKLGRLDEAEVSLRRALEINPNIAEVHCNLGNALRGLGRLDEAVDSYRRALEIRPDYVEAHSNLGVSFKEQGRLEEAEASCRRALEIKPDNAEAHNNLGNILQCMGRSDEAEACYRQALEIKPDYAEGHNNLGLAKHISGQVDEALPYHRRALELKPGYVMAHSNLIFTLDMAANMSLHALHDERKKWGKIHAAHLLQKIPHNNIPDPERRLRIGYVSADFREHSAARTFGSMLMSFDRSRFDVFAYTNSVQTDELTERFRQSATCWRKIVGLSDDAVAGLVRQDEIDILVDLSGFSAGNRLLVFARKPAPLQITAWGYATGTGMQAMDVLFSDPVVVPPDEQQLHTEQVRYLPCFLTYSPPSAPPAVNELPALSAGHITFGSFNRLSKVSGEAYRTWAQVLLAMPDSRMVLKAGELDDAATRARVTGHFTRAGVAPERLSLLGKTSWPDHMAAFNRIDISLDTFPQGGGVTALEGLLMGVPLVTLYRRQAFAGRASASILTTLGLPDWIAETPEQYVEIALRKARDISALAELRRQMRDRFMSSVIGDTEAYTRIVEQEYRQLWREWCGR